MTELSPLTDIYDTYRQKVIYEIAILTGIATRTKHTINDIVIPTEGVPVFNRMTHEEFEDYIYFITPTLIPDWDKHKNISNSRQISGKIYWKWFTTNLNKNDTT